MKFGFRTPSLKKSFSARTKGRMTRSLKKAIMPAYGKKGMGWLHPKRKIYNSVYKKVTIDALDPLKHPRKSAKKTTIISPRKKFVLPKYIFGTFLILAGLILISESMFISFLEIFAGFLYIAWGRKSSQENKTN